MRVSWIGVVGLLLCHGVAMGRLRIVQGAHKAGEINPLLSAAAFMGIKIVPIPERR